MDPGQPDYSITPAAPSRACAGYRAAREIAPVVTVIIPYFNMGPILFETVEALKRQSLQQMEWVFVDDASTAPESAEILKEAAAYSGSCPSRIVRHAENRGLSAARNTGIKDSRAPYVFLQDADDLIEPTALEKFIWVLLTRPELGFVTSFEVGFGDTEYRNTNGFHDTREYLLENRTCPLTMVRKDVFDAAGAFDETLRQGLEDWDFWLRCAENGIWGGTVPEFLKWYRRSRAQIGRWADWDMGERQAQFMLRLIEKYPKLYSGYFPEPVWKYSPLTAIFENPLALPQPLLFLFERLTDVEAAAVKEAAEARPGRHLTVVALGEGERSAEETLLRITPDLFITSRFIPEPFVPEFLRYLAGSRKFTRILIGQSTGALAQLPALSAICGSGIVATLPEKLLAGEIAGLL